ncbi:hypothetical protein [Gilvibacter sp.]|uniref:hypothetical protein n=1 Tax=Gilvibacter sp. TaxID=2729997 RepID=UPI003F49E938
MSTQVILITVHNYLYKGSTQPNTDAKITLDSVENRSPTPYLPGRYHPQFEMPATVVVGTNASTSFYVPFNPGTNNNAKINVTLSANNMNGSHTFSFDTNDKSYLAISLYSSSGNWSVHTSPPIS